MDLCGTLLGISASSAFKQFRPAEKYPGAKGLKLREIIFNDLSDSGLENISLYKSVRGSRSAFRMV